MWGLGMRSCVPGWAETCADARAVRGDSTFPTFPFATGQGDSSPQLSLPATALLISSTHSAFTRNLPPWTRLDCSFLLEARGPAKGFRRLHGAWHVFPGFEI